MKLAIAIRGHERGTFENSDFSDLIYELSKLYDTEIFIHSWELSEAESSWRNLKNIKYPITKENIENYFSRNKDQIKKIYVDSEKDIEYHGRTQGKLGRILELPCTPQLLKELLIKNKQKWSEHLVVNNAHFSAYNKELNKYVFILETGYVVLPWKKMWHGIHKIIKEVYESKTKYDAVLNTRIDILNYKFKSNPSSPEMNFNIINNLIKNFLSQKENFLFTTKNNAACIDNVYVGTKKHMYLLCKEFHYKLDKILEEFKVESWEGIHEKLVYLQAKKYINKF